MKGTTTIQAYLDTYDCHFSKHAPITEVRRIQIDFLLQNDTEMIPVEVKAEENLQSKNIRSFIENNPGLHGARFSMSGYRKQEWMTNFPLFAIQVLFYQQLRINVV